MNQLLPLLLICCLASCSPGETPTASNPQIPAASDAPAQAESNATGAVADFALTQLDGNPWRLSEQGARPKLIMFWATWCPYCKLIFPEIQAIHEEFSPKLKVAAISVRDDGDVAAYVRKRGLTMDILVEGDAVAEQFEVPGTPAILLLSADNKIVFGTLESDPNNPELRQAVSTIMGVANAP